MAIKIKWSKEERRIQRIILINRLYGMIYHAACGVFIRVFRPHIWQLAVDIDTLWYDLDPCEYWNSLIGLYFEGLPENRLGMVLFFATLILHKEYIFDESTIEDFFEEIENEKLVNRARQIQKRLHDCYGPGPEGTL